MSDVDVVVIGGGVCGVLAGQRFAAEGISYKIIEKFTDFGGVWSYRANDYSHLQAHAALYAWDYAKYPLHQNPFKKCNGTIVLETLRRFANDHGLRDNTVFDAEVQTVDDENGRYNTTYMKAGKKASIRSTAVFVACGLLGKQHSIDSRNLPGIEKFTSLKMFAGKQADAQNFLNEHSAKGKDVVILGSGAFGLEAMEAARRARAKSITLVTRDRDRWIVPYSEQFKFIFLSHAPLVPRKIRCMLMNWWLTTVYKKARIGYMAPSIKTPQNFTGQCNDAFFQYPKQGIAKFMIDGVESFDENTVRLQSGVSLNADILVTAHYQENLLKSLSTPAVGHEIQERPSFLANLGVGFTTDLHNYAFLGKNPYLGAASDWVWFNVPHGPMKQIDSFVVAFKACQAGAEEAVRAALLPTPFKGCKGEPLNWRSPSGFVERDRAYWRTLSAGKTLPGKALLAARMRAETIGVYTIVFFMYMRESIKLRDWLLIAQ